MFYHPSTTTTQLTTTANLGIFYSIFMKIDMEDKNFEVESLAY